MLSAFFNNEFLDNTFCDVIALLVNNCKNFIRVKLFFELLFIHFLFLLVPVPLINLTGLQSNFLSKFLHELSSPVQVLNIFILEDFNLLLILSSSLLLINQGKILWGLSWNLLQLSLTHFLFLLNSLGG